ncbi:vWFA domain containing protein [uncultured Caudovirales phage]|uniref:VWFA domain containing protein n=1 Tax=uncultured Caudovirales phage TaxID=2100421 RepID=A0A6J5NIH5_9CAUD|nr:vWFA domain containing protein [uncultured Caudovirales phage]CAB5224406.1 vWFA domain containing protein [uncultured Caudovirales phage]
MSLIDRLSKARIALILDIPFFGALSFKLQNVIDNSIPTACTDGLCIRFNEDYCATLNDAELVGLLVEEIGHCAFEHLWRMGTRDKERWNVACDQVLWNMIAELSQTSRRVALSADCVIRSEYIGLSAEEIYHLLPQQRRNSPPRGEFTQPGSQPNGKDPQTNAEELRAEWVSNVQAIATAERMKKRGQLPGWLDTLVQSTLQPRIPWVEVLREFANVAARDDFSTARPNRRYLQSGFILPSLYSERVGPIIVAIDTSGSINMTILQEMLTELQSILDSGKPQSITLIDCDSRIHQIRDFTPGDNITDFKVKGGGGTSFRPVFTHIADEAQEPACLIYLTDMDGSFPQIEPHYPTLWISYGHPAQHAPFGRTIHVA